MSSEIGLGRLRAVDDRDRKFLLPVGKREAAGKLSRYWNVPSVLDQLATSQCVGFSGWQWLRCGPTVNVPPFTPEHLYREAQKIDEWPGEDYEGTSVRACFKILRNLGYVSEYRWAFDCETIVNHILNVGPVVVGTTWTMGMFATDEDGFIDDVDGESVGGHAYLLIGANRLRRTPGGGKGAVRVVNSWGPRWGQGGRAWLSFRALDWLMSQDGEACAALEVRRPAS